MTSVTSAGILNAAVARVSAARNDITAAEAPQESGEAAKGGEISATLKAALALYDISVQRY
jgi:hypothetical protein